MEPEAPTTFLCLYCNIEKPDAERTVEHAVPKFLGGSYAPSRFHLRDVCRRCNNILGLHVDGSYARNWFITNRLALAARKVYAGPNAQQPGLPLVCMGEVSNVEGLTVPEGSVVEFWLGPSGESIVWVRPASLEMPWYVGGNPIDKKRKDSTLYFIPTAPDLEGLQMALDAFREAFDKAQARRIFGATCAEAPPDGLLRGFDMATPADWANVHAIHTAIRQGSLRGQMTMKTTFDERFICKMVLGIGYSLFGSAFLASEIASRARVGLWSREVQEGLFRGATTLDSDEGIFESLAGYPGAVALLVQRTDDIYTLTLTVDQTLPFTTELAPGTLGSGRANLDDGYVLLLWPQLRLAIEPSYPEMLAHKLGRVAHGGLAELDELIRQAQKYHASRPKLSSRKSND